jgi:hypothetical protein
MRLKSGPEKQPAEDAIKAIRRATPILPLVPSRPLRRLNSNA